MVHPTSWWQWNRTWSIDLGHWHPNSCQFSWPTHLGSGMGYFRALLCICRKGWQPGPSLGLHGSWPAKRLVLPPCHFLLAGRLGSHWQWLCWTGNLRFCAGSCHLEPWMIPWMIPLLYFLVPAINWKQLSSEWYKCIDGPYGFCKRYFCPRCN